MRITSNANSSLLINQLQTLTARQQKYQNQAATGQRITNPEDDPAAMGRVLNAQAEKSSVQQFNNNANRALDLSQSSFSGLSGLKDISDRAGEIAAMVGGTTDATSMKAYSVELNQLMEQALQTGNSQLNGTYLYGGTKTDAAPFTATRDAAGQITGATYQGAASGAAIAVDAGTSISPFTSGTDNQGISQFINTLATLRDALASGNASTVQATQPALTTSENHLLDTLGNLGAVQTRLQAAGTANASRFSSLENQISADADADLPTTIIQLNKTQSAYQAALQTGAKIMGQSLLDYVK